MSVSGDLHPSRRPDGPVRHSRPRDHTGEHLPRITPRATTYPRTNRRQTADFAAVGEFVAARDPAGDGDCSQQRDLAAVRQGCGAGRSAAGERR